MKKQLSFLVILLSTLFITGCENTVTDTNLRVLGNENASIVIEEFSDIECPACSVISPAVEEVVRRNLDDVKLIYRHFPLSYHEYAFIGAEAAECAGDQGKFWEYLGAEFKNNNALTDDFFYNLADQLNLDLKPFKICLDTHAKKDKVINDYNEGRKRQIPGTPTMFVNGQMIKWSGIESFEGYIKSLVK